MDLGALAFPLIRKEFKVRNLFAGSVEGDLTTGKINIGVPNKEVNVRDYDKTLGIEMEVPSYTYKAVLADKDVAVNELIDGYVAQSVPEDIKAKRLESGAYGLGLALENKALTELIKKDNYTLYGDENPLTKENVYEEILKMIATLTKKGHKKEDLAILVNSDTEITLLTDNKFSASGSTLTDDLRTNGVIGKINGVRVVPVVMDNTVEAVVFDTKFVFAHDVFNVPLAINDLKDGKHIGASALQGRSVAITHVADKTAVALKKNVREI